MVRSVHFLDSYDLTLSLRSITWGILIQYFVQFGCSYIDDVASFRIPWGLQMIPAIVLSLGMLVFPESPRFLLDTGRYAFRCRVLQNGYWLVERRDEEALQVLADLHGGGDKTNALVVLEYEEIKQQVNCFLLCLGRWSWRSLGPLRAHSRC